MLGHDIGIIAYSRPRLGFPWGKGVNLACRLVDQRKHNLEGNVLLLKQTGTEVVHVIDKIAGKDSCNMQVPTTVAIHLIHDIADGMGQRHEQRQVGATLQKDGNLTEIHRPRLAERLHGVEYASTQRGQSGQRHAACRMYEEGSCPLPWIARTSYLAEMGINLISDLLQDGITDTEEKDIHITLQPGNLIGIVAPQAFCQSLGRTFRTTIYLHELMPGLL